jgi:hypothetical protein
VIGRRLGLLETGNVQEIDEKHTGTMVFDRFVDGSVLRTISELMSENAQLQPLSSDLPSHTPDFGAQPMQATPKLVSQLTKRS